MRLILTATLLIALAVPVLAQPRPKAGEPAASVRKPAAEQPQDDGGAAYRKKAEERQRAWDRRMRETMRGICIGC